jgi:hypothetical protein
VVGVSNLQLAFNASLEPGATERTRRLAPRWEARPSSPQTMSQAVRIS